LPSTSAIKGDPSSCGEQQKVAKVVPYGPPIILTTQQSPHLLCEQCEQFAAADSAATRSDPTRAYVYTNVQRRVGGQMLHQGRPHCRRHRNLMLGIMRGDEVGPSCLALAKMDGRPLPRHFLSPSGLVRHVTRPAVELGDASHT
jgi:hypothetical protein